MIKFTTRPDIGEVSGDSQEYMNVQYSEAADISSSKLFRNIKGIIFDFDGTLFDNANIPFYLISAYPPDILRIWKERLVRKQFEGCDYSTPDEYYKNFFITLGKACRRSPERMRAWYFNRFIPRMIRMLQNHYKPRYGVIEMFKRINSLSGARKKGIAAHSLNDPADFPKIAVYSDYPFLKERMEALGINPGSSVLLYTPESFGAQKPAVRPFRCIAGDIGFSPEEVLVIGDREDTDGLGAFRAGMRFFCLKTGRKRYFKLDPYRSPPMKGEEPQGPSLIMYSGTWEELIKLVIEKFSSKNQP